MNSELIGSIGTILMLAAFLLNLLDKLDNGSILYASMNFIGASLACIASFIINYTPFIILEGTWAIISGWAVYNYFKTLINNRGEDKKNS